MATINSNKTDSDSIDFPNGMHADVTGGKDSILKLGCFSAYVYWKGKRENKDKHHSENRFTFRLVTKDINNNTTPSMKGIISLISDCPLRGNLFIETAIELAKRYFS